MKDSPHKFLNERSQQFGDDRCFLCGAHIPTGSEDRTVEHVFPKWLLKELDLWDQGLTQLNGRNVAYRKMTVPCCQTCNGQHLSDVENRVRTAYRNGFEDFTALDRKDLFIWLGKIYYGLVYKESLQPRYLHQQDGERLVPEEHLRYISFHHFLLQSASGAVRWEPEFPGPASFRIFRCHDHGNPRRRFDYLDSLMVPLLALRMGPIGIVAVLQDWGRTEPIGEVHLDAAAEMVLHPTQFREVYGRIAYLTEQAWMNKKHVITSAQGKATVLTVPDAVSGGTFNPERLAHIMSVLWSVPHEAIYRDGSTVSTLSDADGVPTPTPDQEVMFPTPFGEVGLWPAHTEVVKPA